MQFNQPDSIIPNPGSPGDYNRYAYARYNPVRYQDPTGHSYYDPGCDCMVVGATPEIEVYIHDQNLDYTNTGGQGLGDIFENPLLGVFDPTDETIIVDPPDIGDFEDGEYLGPPPSVPGLNPDDWDWDPDQGGFTHPDDPGAVWRPDGGYDTGSEGEMPHWDREGKKWPPNPEWGRGPDQPSYPPDYNPDTGRYVVATLVVIGSGVALSGAIDNGIFGGGTFHKPVGLVPVVY